MKILIVDDEKLTREGIISNIDWLKLGINEVFEADDGLNGLEAAKQHKPQIVLSDVRMPRMNGIEMAKELHKFLPETSIIFMSGYSDKEYLKEAIKLKVVSYVEKPIDSAEIETSVRNALEDQLIYAKNQIKTAYHNKYSIGKLGLKIIYPLDKDSLSDYTGQFEDFGFKIKPVTEFTTVILNLRTPVSGIPEQSLDALYFKIEEIAAKFRVSCIPAVKNDEYILLHFFTNHKTSEYMLSNICGSIASFLVNSYQYYITVGKTVKGLKNVYESYNTAVILLQSAFFYEYNSIIYTADSSPAPQPFDQKLFIGYQEALAQKDRGEALHTVEQIYSGYANNQQVLPNYVKDLYYKLFSELIRTASRLHVPDFYEEDRAEVLEYIIKDKNLFELNGLLLAKINQLFDAMEEHAKDNTTIYAIKDFISRNYKNENLSVKDISEHVYLSSSYVCTLFKNETGSTLNQYLTEFRIEKAKAMLRDSRYKITDISSKVGYSDGNYFGKTFKKLVDLSPSEYRERFGK